MEAMKDTSIDPILNPKNKSYVKNDIFLHFAVYIHCGWYDKGTFCQFFYLGPSRIFVRKFHVEVPRVVRTGPYL